ncbi:MAG: hypothetical protein R3E31_01805 [Chloroflexota bacterium]
MTNWKNVWRERAQQLKIELYALYLAYKDHASLSMHESSSLSSLGMRLAPSTSSPTPSR